MSFTLRNLAVVLAINQGFMLLSRFMFSLLPERAGCCDQSRTLHNQHMDSHSTGKGEDIILTLAINLNRAYSVFCLLWDFECH